MHRNMSNIADNCCTCKMITRGTCVYTYNVVGAEYGEYKTVNRCSPRYKCSCLSRWCTTTTLGPWYPESYRQWACWMVGHVTSLVSNSDTVLEITIHRYQTRFCQTSDLGLRLEVDFVFPLSQEQEEQEQQPLTKIYRKDTYYRLGIWHIDL